MKRDLQAKFLMHMASKKQEDEGFTLIELLVVIIIIGILAAIALPSLLGQVNKAKQSEAKNNIGAVNRAQQAYLLENTFFAPNIALLEVGIRTQSVNYKYSIDATSSGAVIDAVNAAFPLSPKLKAYAGLNGTLQGNTQTNEVLSLGTACESEKVNEQTAIVGSGSVPNLDQSAPCNAANANWKDLGK